MTIRLRLTIFNATTVLLTTIAAFAVGATLFGIYLFRDPYPLVSSPAHEVAYRITSGEVMTQATLDQIADKRVEITLIDVNGLPTLSTDTPRTVVGAPEFPVWQDAEAVAARVDKTVPAEDDETFVTVLPIITNGEISGFIDVRSSYEAYVTALINEYVFVPIIAAAILAITVLLILASYILTWRALRPVNQIAKEANKISETDLSRRLPVHGGKRDEFARLSRSFNSLLDRIHRSVLEREAIFEAQRRFVADAGHELRTPLTSIRGYARMLDEWGLQDETVAREGIDVIERESARLQELAEGLLIVARGDEQLAPELLPGDLRTPVFEAVEALRLNSSGVTLDTVIPNQPVIALFEDKRVRQLVTILVDNAIKYSPSGATVTTTVAVSSGVPTLVVSDNGIGIAEEELPKIFERFYRVDESRGNRGAGLGLSIARQIVDRHEARISVQSYVGRGTRFTITFKAPTAESTPSAPSKTRRFVRSLLVRLHLRKPAIS